MTTDPRIAQIEEHAKAWFHRFEKLVDQKLEQFATESLDKKTAITCSAFLLDAIEALHRDIIEIAKNLHPEQSDFKYLGPREPNGPRFYCESPQEHISEILVEASSGLDQNELIEAHCYAGNFQRYELLFRDPENTKLLERALAEISKIPWPKE